MRDKNLPCLANDAKWSSLPLQYAHPSHAFGAQQPTATTHATVSCLLIAEVVLIEECSSKHNLTPVGPYEELCDCEYWTPSGPC